MTTNDQTKERVSGALLPAFDETKASPPPKRPSSDVFGRMPKPKGFDAQSHPPARRPGIQVPTVRRRRRVAGVVMPLVVAAAGFGSAYVLLETTRSLPIALVCAGLGLIGAVFCYILMRDRVEVT